MTALDCARRLEEERPARSAVGYTTDVLFPGGVVGENDGRKANRRRRRRALPPGRLSTPC